jgi:hypothetical protein
VRWKNIKTDTKFMHIMHGPNWHHIRCRIARNFSWKLVYVRNISLLNLHWVNFTRERNGINIFNLARILNSTKLGKKNSIRIKFIPTRHRATNWKPTRILWKVETLSTQRKFYCHISHIEKVKGEIFAKEFHEINFHYLLNFSHQYFDQ